MFEVYSAYGFKFYETREGNIYVANIQDMINLNGAEMTEACLKACELYNSVVIQK